jgi:hypothetical protein
MEIRVKALIPATKIHDRLAPTLTQEPYFRTLSQKALLSNMDSENAFRPFEASVDDLSEVIPDTFWNCNCFSQRYLLIFLCPGK